MAGNTETEVYMRIFDNRGKPLEAEAQTEMTTDYDDLVTEWLNGQFFQLDSFRIGMNIEDYDPDKNNDKDRDKRHGAPPPGASSATRTQMPGTAKKQAGGRLAKWRSAKLEDAKKLKFDLTMDELSITRRYDKASLVIFERCALSDPFPGASIIKRKVVGGDKLQTFLRFDFRELLVTNIQFEDDDVLKETIKLAFRRMRVRYKTQNADGSLSKTVLTSTYNCDVKLRPDNKPEVFDDWT